MNWANFYWIAVTGWKSVYVNRGFTNRINEVTKDESDVILQYLFNVSHQALTSSKTSHFQLTISDKLTISSSPKTTTPKSDSSGTKMISRFGIIARHGILPLTITARHVLETGCAVWVRLLILIASRNRGGRLWQGMLRELLVNSFGFTIRISY